MKGKDTEDKIKLVKISLSTLNIIGKKPKLTKSQWAKLKKTKTKIKEVISGEETLDELLKTLKKLNKELEKTFKN